MSVSIRSDFHLTEELHKTIVHSLVSSFGLDFLLFEDKKGGDVATINNARKHQNGDSDIFLSDDVKQGYDHRGKYDSHAYHADKSYIEKGKADKALHMEGKLHDSYRNSDMQRDEKRQLDHIISASEVHNDAGRVLSGLDGVELSNQGSNFQSTYGYINTLKSNHTMDSFLNDKLPNAIDKKNKNIKQNEKKLSEMSNVGTPELQHKKRELESKIAKDKEHLEVLESIDHDKMREADKQARKQYDAQIDAKYYTSSKFLKSTGMEAAKSGVKMGMRQAVGMILAEVWFELKEQIPLLYKDAKGNFSFELFLERLKSLASGIWLRIKKRFKDILVEFKDGVLSGVISSLTTTIMNIFFTTQKLVVKLIREMWSSLVSAAKLVFFNPNKLSPGDLSREIMRIISTGVAVAMGVILNKHLATMMTFPFGSEIAAFVSAIATGLMTLGFTYFLDHSELMQKVWSYLNQFKSDARKTLEYYQKVNLELDRYLVELSALEFNLNPIEMSKFTDSLVSLNCEFEKGILLNQEITKRDIDLPFEPSNLDSTRNWLSSL